MGFERLVLVTRQTELEALIERFQTRSQADQGTLADPVGGRVIGDGLILLLAELDAVDEAEIRLRSLVRCHDQAVGHRDGSGRCDQRDVPLAHLGDPTGGKLPAAA